jgi:ribonuclease BN (tRNA processing enzyme)
MTRYISPLLLLLFFASNSYGQCKDSDLRLQVLGSGGPELDDGRASASYLIWHKDKAILMIDAGPGSSVAFGASGANFSDIEAILLTHLHVDHSADLPAFIKGSYFTERDQDLRILGPGGNTLMPATSKFVTSLLSAEGAFAYLQEYIDPSVDSDFKVNTVDISVDKVVVSHYKLNDEVQLSAVPVHHGPVAAIAWRVDVGQCAVSFSGDMSNRYGSFALMAKDSDMIVVHNAIPEHAGQAARNLHMPPSEIAKLVAATKTGQVAISHRMKRTFGTEQQTLSQIRALSTAAVYFANDMDVFPIAGKLTEH